jgi:hypothetical protein
MHGEKRRGESFGVVVDDLEMEIPKLATLATLLKVDGDARILSGPYYSLVDTD